jgi:hypothetical protein
MDPYDEFTSGYVGMGNDPVNMVDPSGGLSMSAIGDVLSQVACPTWGNGLTQLFTTAAKIGSMGSMLNMLTQMHTRTLQAELIAGQLMANVATQAGDGKQGNLGVDDEWNLLYKNGVLIGVQWVSYYGGDFRDIVHHVDVDKIPYASAILLTTSVSVEKRFQTAPFSAPMIKKIGLRLETINIGPARGNLTYVDVPGFISFGIYGGLMALRSFTATKGAGSLKIPIYRVYGEGASMYGKSYSLINPKYVPFYRNFAGLPNVNSGQYLLKGSIPLRDIKVGRWFAAPLDGNTGGLPFELYQNYNQLINPANVILKKTF